MKPLGGEHHEVLHVPTEPQESWSQRSCQRPQLWRAGDNKREEENKDVLIPLSRERWHLLLLLLL